MLHRAPERYIPEAYIILSRMRGDRGTNTVASHDLAGSIPQQAEEAMAILEGWLGREPSRKGARILNRKWALPMEAVREAVSNALFHRRYSIPRAIKIALYATKLEVFSPGHFAGPFVPESLGDGCSYIRNRVVCTLARRMGLIEKRGTGIKLMQDAMADFGLPAPVFEEGSQWFKVTLSMMPKEKQASAMNYQELILEMIEKAPEISSSDVCSRLGVSKVTAVRLLGQLITRGLIKKVGRGPKTRYVPG